MTTDAASRAQMRRPLLVTIVLVMVYLSGLSNAALGLLVLLSRYQVPADEVLIVSLVGAAIILLGLLTLAVASAVGRGRRLARLAVTVYLTVQFVLHVLTVVTTEWDPVTLVQILIDVFIVGALWTPPGSRWFRR